QQLRPHAHLKQVGDLEELRQKPRHRNFTGGPAHDWLADGPERLCENRHVLGGRHIARLQMNFRYSLVVFGDETVKDFRKEAPLLDADAAHNAEIDGDEGAVARVGEEVSLVHVRMEEAVADGMLEEGTDDVQTEQPSVEACRLDRRDI